jgi:hypothetical protein
MYGYFPIMSILFLMQLINVVNVRSLALYLWAVLVLLFAPGLQFLYLVQSALDDIGIDRRR